MRVGTRWIGAAGALIVAIALIATGRFASVDGTIMAQDAASPAAQAVQANQPVSVHQGVCGQTIPDPVHELNNLIPYGQNDDGTFDNLFGSVPGLPVLFQESTIDGSFEDLTVQPYAIAIHESPETYGTLVACADIGGPATDDRMIVAIRSLGGSGFAGIGIIQADGDQLNITTYIVPQVNAEPQAQPAGQTTPVAATPTA